MVVPPVTYDGGDGRPSAPGINAKVLRLGIEQSEREAARVTKLKRKQGRIVRRVKGYIIISDSSDDYGSDYDGSDIDPPPAAELLQY